MGACASARASCLSVADIELDGEGSLLEQQPADVLQLIALAVLAIDTDAALGLRRASKTMKSKLDPVLRKAARLKKEAWKEKQKGGQESGCGDDGLFIEMLGYDPRRAIFGGF